MNIQTRNKQQGFTLVEIAIVLVIIGLLLGGMLKGQELIESSRVKAAAADMNGIAAAYSGYIDRYRRLPGDDGDTDALKARGGNWGSATGGNLNGAINATTDDVFAGTSEVATFFQHLRTAGFLTGNPAATGVAVLPINAWGGLTGILNAVSIQGRPAGVTRLMICMGSVPGKAALALDSQLDDGAPGTGTLRATTSTAANTVPGVAAASYDEGATYTICRDLS